MTNLVRAQFQAHPFHLVEPSPWPLVTSFALLTLTVSGVMTMHGYAFGGYLTVIGLFSVIGTMIFWFRDIIAEGKKKLRRKNVPSLNSTVCWKNLISNGFLLKEKLSQSAGNLFYIIKQKKKKEIKKKKIFFSFKGILRDFTSSNINYYNNSMLSSG